MRVSALIKTSRGFLLLHRIKNERDYYCTPGGHVEKNETQKSELIRECREELGIKIKIKKKVYEIEKNCYNEKEVFYECEIVSGILGSGNAEEFKNKKNGIYRLKIIKIGDIPKINLLPEEIKNYILRMKNYSLEINRN